MDRTLTWNLVQELNEQQPEHGMLSVFVHATSGEPTDTWRLRMRACLHELQERCAEETDRTRRRALDATIHWLEDRIAQRMSRKDARSLVAFAPVRADGHEATFVAFDPPVPFCARVDDRAHVTPLVRVLARWPRVGVVCASHGGVRIHQWTFGRIEQIVEFHYDVDTSNWSRREGPGMSNPARVQHSAPQTDTFDRLVLLQQEAFLRDRVVPAVRGVAAHHEWDAIITYGPALVHDELVAHPSGLPRVHDGGQLNVVDEPIDALASRVRTLLDDDRVAYEQQMVQAVMERAAQEGGAGVLGASAVQRMLDERRVERLLIEVNGDTPDPYVDEFVHRALTFGGRITPVDTPAASALRTHDGVGALLHWGD